MGKSTISMAIFNSYVKWPEGNNLTYFGDTRRSIQNAVGNNTNRPLLGLVSGGQMLEILHQPTDYDLFNDWWFLVYWLSNLFACIQSNFILIFGRVAQPRGSVIFVENRPQASTLCVHCICNLVYRIFIGVNRNNRGIPKPSPFWWALC